MHAGMHADAHDSTAGLQPAGCSVPYLQGGTDGGQGRGPRGTWQPLPLYWLCQPPLPPPPLSLCRSLLPAALPWPRCTTLLCRHVLQDEDSVNAETFIKKAAALITAAKDEALELQYKVLRGQYSAVVVRYRASTGAAGHAGPPWKT